MFVSLKTVSTVFSILSMVTLIFRDSYKWYLLTEQTSGVHHLDLCIALFLEYQILYLYVSNFFLYYSIWCPEIGLWSKSSTVIWNCFLCAWGSAPFFQGGSNVMNCLLYYNHSPVWLMRSAYTGWMVWHFSDLLGCVPSAGSIAMGRVGLFILAATFLQGLRCFFESNPRWLICD